jgi:hypothetical protein
MIKLVPRDYLVQQGLPAIIEGEKVVMRQVTGLNHFLKAWLGSSKENAYAVDDALKFMRNLDDYLRYRNVIFKFMHDKGRFPEKDEAWDLGVPVQEIDLITDLINVTITHEIVPGMTIQEKRYYDDLSKKLLRSRAKLDSLKQENLAIEYQLNLFDAKIVPKFISEFAAIKDLMGEISKDKDFSNLNPEDKRNFNELATRIIKDRFLEGKNASLIDLARYLGTGIMNAGEVIYFLNNPARFVQTDFTSRDDIHRLSRKLVEAIEYCQASKAELDATLLVRKFGMNFLDAHDAIALYSHKFTLPAKLSMQERNILDDQSKNVIKYIKEVNPEPSIDELMVKLTLNIRDANYALQFINRVPSEQFNEDFNSYPDSVQQKVDDLAIALIHATREAKDKKDLISLAHEVGHGIYSTKRAVAYIAWVEQTIDETYIKGLSSDVRTNIEAKIKEALRYIKDHGLELSIDTLVDEIGFGLKDTHLIVKAYNMIISRAVDVAAIDPGRQATLEQLSRQVYNAKKNGKIASYEPELVFTLDLEPVGTSSSTYRSGRNVPLDDVWEALVLLKVKVLQTLTSETKTVKTDFGSIVATENVQLKENYGVKLGKKENVTLTKESINLTAQEISFKSIGERVELKRGCDYEGGYVRYKVVIKNNSETAINNLEVSLRMLAEHIRVISVKPQIYKAENGAKIPSMAPMQSESVDFYLEPLICGSIPVTPVTTYFDAFGKVRMVTKEPLTVASTCPFVITPGSANIAIMKNIFEQNDKRSFRSFELKNDARVVFNLLMEAVNPWTGKPVSPPHVKNDSPFSAEVYYLVENKKEDPELKHKEQIVIKIDVDEAKGVAMLHASAERNETMIGVLTHLWHDLVNPKLGELYGYRLEALPRCPEDNAPLEFVNKAEGILRCKYHGEEYKLVANVLHSMKNDKEST